MFQFSPSHRGHPLSACAPGYINQVSILALAQRASKLRQYGCLLINRFNSRPRTEGIRCSCSRSSQGCCFNSRPRTEGIAHGAADGVHCRCFNSRPRTEGIGNTLTAWSRIKSFNSRPRTEGILSASRKGQPNQVSILALAQRASHSQAGFRRCASSFNSRPRTEGIRKNRQIFPSYFTHIT